MHTRLTFSSGRILVPWLIYGTSYLFYKAFWWGFIVWVCTEIFELSVLIFIFFVIRWLNPLLSLGSKRPLEAQDFYGLRSHDSTAVVGDQLQRYGYFQLSNSGQLNVWTKVSLATSMCFILICSFIFIVQKTKTFYEIGMIRC